MEIRKKSDLYYASDEEIEVFFKNVIFRGQYSELSLEHEDKRFCGKIEHITINGMTNDLCPASLYVPAKFGHFVKPGLCEFNAVLNTTALKKERHQYRLIIIRIKNVEQVFVKRDKQAESKFRYNLKLKDDKFVGLFTENKDGSFTIRDIRRSDFSKLILQNGKEQAPIVYHPHLFKPKDGVYYEFSWVLNGEKENYVYLFKVDETQSFQEVSPRNLIQRLHDDIMNYPAGAGQKIVKMLDTLKNQLTASGKEIFIYELLQNANDYPVTIDSVKQKVNVEFHLTLSSLIFMHSGAVFNERNIAAICSINDKEKDTNKDAIGYKGIGFKTVFLDNENVYLQTGAYSFRFDRQATRDIVDTPWQILPIWTKYQELTQAERAIFTQAGEAFRVKFALKPTRIETLRDSAHNYENMFREIFKNERVILFIPNLSSVKVYLQGTPVSDIICNRDNDTWRVDDFNENIDEEITEAINDDIDEQEDTGGLKIPTKYYDFKNTKVSFACEVDGRKLRAVKDTCLYCYLPAKDATWGLKFLMNTDMIPNGARDDVEVDFSNSTNVNETIANIAGSKLFEWILKLNKCREYELDSVFDLVPNFASLKSGRLKYKELINSFENGFVNRLKTDELIPTQDGYICLQDVILDKTGLASSGIMSDEEFLRFSNNDSNHLPVLELRNSKSFETFAEQYLRKFDVEENIFDKDSLREMINEDEFQEWLKVQDNNDKFLKFLLDKEYIEDLLDEDIFLEVEGGLFKASELFYDIDNYLVDLKAFTNHICYLSLATRDFFKGNQNWNDIVEDSFATFDCEVFVNDVLLSSSNISDTNEKLNDKDTSIHFFKFLSENVSFDDNYTSLPFISDSDEVEEDFEDKFVFLKSEKEHAVFKEEWLSSVDVAFVSPDYSQETKKYFVDYFGVQQFSDEIVVKQIILSEDYHDTIVGDINEDYNSSKSFVDYCYAHNEFFESGSLRNYSLSVYDIKGENVWCLSEDHIYFLTDIFEDYSKKEWLDDDWMYSLDSDYYNGISNKVDFKKFIEQKFWVEELSDKSFYIDVVKRNLKSIIVNTSGNNDGDGKKNIDFIKFLDDNYSLIFEEEKDSDVFSGIYLVSDDVSDLNVDKNVYVYDQELADIMDRSWFPEDVVYLCNKEYGDSKALKAIGCNSFNFGSFYDDVIVEELDTINDNIDTKEDSIAFHNFIIEHLGELTTNQQNKMSSAKVFLYGNNEPADTASGHKILSAKAKELFEIGLVEFADLDLIDPDYKPEQNSEYWETRLNNTKFTITHFYNWLKDNTDIFKDTLQDVDLNIDFWRWLKDNVDDKQLENIPALPVVLKDGTINNDSTAVYFSDEYMGASGIEQSVLKFDENALFISPDYICEDEDVEDWKDFWIKQGIKYEIVDILIETIIPNLEDIEDEGLPKLIADNRDALEKNYEEDGLISHLTTLRVKGHDDEFYSIEDTIYVDCEKDEPFPYVELPNQITFKTREERELIKDIIEEVDSDFLETLSEWQQRKLDRYLEMQDDDNVSIRSFHYQFIDDLSVIRNTGKDSLKEIEGVEKIYLLNKDDEFCDPSTLTMGSVYKPFFDFEGCGIDSLEYVSDSYIEECSDYPGRLFRALKVHCDIQQDDLKFLESRECAIYFWSKYLTKKEANISRIKDFLEENLFDDITCIPTKDYMKTPSDLYYGAEVSRYVKAIEDWENKIPLKELPEINFSDGTAIFEKLPFKESLDFHDALYALVNIPGQERRTQLLQWMIEDYDSSYDEKINEYREDEHAVWNNNKNESVQIKQLYALDYWEKTLEQYFGTNPRIVNKAYFPSGDAFKEACDILQIQTITLDDLDMEPVEKRVYSARDTNHRLYALAFAALIEPDNWHELYDSYKEKLDEVVFYKCKSILIQYKEDAEISQALKKFYHKPNTTDFYFVKDLDDKLVYESYVKEFTKYLGIDEDDIPFDLAKIIMDSQESALENIMEQNSLMLDEEFKDAMDELIPGIKRELSGNEAEEDKEDEIGSYRPSFTTQEKEFDEDESDDNIDDSEQDYEILNEDEYEFDEGEELEALQEDDAPDEVDFIKATREKIMIGGVEDEVVCEHYRNSTWVRGHMRNGYWVNGYWRNGSNVSAYLRTVGSHVGNEELKKTRADKGTIHDYTSMRKPRERKPQTPSAPTKAGEGKRPYSDMGGWDSPKGNYTPSAPKPYSPDDVRNFGSHGVTRTLEILEPTTSEINEINSILGEDLSSEQVADQNYLAQLRLYNNLVKRGMTPEESKVDFVRNAHLKNEHTIGGGKYIHKCSAAGGIMYLSPAIWNKIADDRCVVCVYLGAKSNDFMYFNSIDDILKWIDEDDIVIKLTGEEKANVVEELYSGVLRGVKGTAYTLVRINSNEKYNSLFAQLPSNEINNTEENEDEYE